MTNGAGPTYKKKRILKDYEAGSFDSIDTTELRADIAAAARNTQRKDKWVNICASEKDFALLHESASSEGIAYQTLMAWVLHKYVSVRPKQGDSGFNHDSRSHGWTSGCDSPM